MNDTPDRRPAPAPRAVPHRTGLQLGAFAVLLALCAPTTSALARDGTYDRTWSVDGRHRFPVGTNKDNAYATLVLPDDRVLVAGICTVTLTPYPTYPCAARLLPNGNIDLSFGPGGAGAFVFNEFVQDAYAFNPIIGLHGVAVQADGRILMAGHAEQGTPGVRTQGVLARLSANGAQPELIYPDVYWHGVIFATNLFTDRTVNIIEAVKVLPNGKILVVGSTNRTGTNPPNRDFAIARFHADLRMDDSFAPGSPSPGRLIAAFDQGGGDFDYAYDAAIQADGKIVVVGYITTDSAGHEIGILRLNPDGSPDAGFGNNGRVWHGIANTLNDIAYAVEIDAQQRIVVTGAKQYAGDDYDFFVARLLPDGALDPSFRAGWTMIAFDLGGPNFDAAYDLAIQTDGKIVLGGSASKGIGTAAVAAVRILPNGEVDPRFGNDPNGRFVGSYSPGTAISDHGQGIGLDSRGHVVIAGTSATGSDPATSDFGVLRLTGDTLFADGFD